MSSRRIFCTSGAFRPRLAVVIIVALLCVSPSLVRYIQGFSTIAGFFSDGLAALLVATPLILLSGFERISRFVRPLILILWFLVQLGSSMLLESMSKLPSWSDLHYATQSEFLENSLAESSSFQPLPVLIFGCAVLLVACCLIWQERIVKRGDDYSGTRSIAGFAVSIVLAMLVCKLAVRFADADENFYAQFNPVHWLLVDALSFRKGEQAVSAAYLLKKDLTGTSLLRQEGKARNVLVIVLEGIPGLYVHAARDRIVPALKTAPVLMPRLSQWAERGMVVPDFIVHNHQTIRGLYALLCSDMDKLTNATPKVYELQNASAAAAQCLPAQMARHGFSTHFLQGAGLGFMGKDQVMPMIGFQQVHGSEWFKEKPAVKFGWGMDDKTFFEGAARYIKTLQTDDANTKPWLLTLLTVGTHQPYAVPKSYARKYTDRRDASVAYLDDAVSGFLDTLQQQGVLDNTLVIVTSDESHGGDLADWISTWGLHIVLAPGQQHLPAIHEGQFALMDTSLSVLDYLGLPADELTYGRSVFRRYSMPREMVSNTAGRLRWLQGNKRYECSSLGVCRECQATSLIGAASCVEDISEPYTALAQKALWLDASVSRLAANAHTLRFANGERHTIAHGWKNEWMDNLIGAQYLDFPAHSRTQVTLRWRAVKTTKLGAKLKLVLKQAEQDVVDIIPSLPVIHTGEETEYSFFIDSEESRANFSFHLLAEAPMDIDLLEFAVTTAEAIVTTPVSTLP